MNATLMTNWARFQFEKLLAHHLSLMGDMISWSIDAPINSTKGTP